MAADYKSVQLTSLAGVGAQLDPGLWGSKVMVYQSHIDLSAVTDGWDKSQSAAMFTFKAGDIPLAIGVSAGVTLGSAKISVGIEGTLAKYAPLATNTAVGVLKISQIAVFAKLTADEEVWVTNDATADMPTTTFLFCFGFYTRH